MTQRNRSLLIQFALAIAFCASIGIFDRPLLGLIGVLLCLVVFGLRAFGSTRSRVVRSPPLGTSPAATADDEEVADAERGTPSYNPRNPAFPLYYPPADRD